MTIATMAAFASIQPSLTHVALACAALALATALTATFGFVMFALYGVGGVRAATTLVDHRRALALTTVAFAAVATVGLTMRPPEATWLLALGWLTTFASVLAWVLFLPMVPERRFRALVAPDLHSATDSALAGDTRVLGFRTPQGPIAIPVSVAAWHHIFELPAGDAWHVGTY